MNVIFTEHARVTVFFMQVHEHHRVLEIFQRSLPPPSLSSEISFNSLAFLVPQSARCVALPLIARGSPS